MSRARFLVALVALSAGATASACAPTSAPVAPIVAPPPPAAPAPPPPVDFDPVALGMTEAGIADICDAHLLEATKIIEALKTLKGAPASALTFDATLGRFDDMRLEVSNATDFAELMKEAHPDLAVRRAAMLCEPRAQQFTSGLWLDADLAKILQAYAAKNEPLDEERARMRTDVIRGFKRNGLGLSPDNQKVLSALSAEITKVGQEFLSNITEGTRKIQVRAASLDGLPDEYIAAHRPNAQGNVTITTDYPDFFPFVTFAKDRKAAADLYVLFTNRGEDKNVLLIEKLLTLRHDQAKLLGYKSWAEYAIEPRMAKTPEAVHAFLERVRDALKAPAKAEFAALLAEHVKLGGHASDKIAAWDRLYLVDQASREKFGFSAQDLLPYFEIGAVTKGVLDVASRMYGLVFAPLQDPVWHPDVSVYEVRQGSVVLGKVYLDLYTRPKKYKHDAVFSVRARKHLKDGRVQLPLSVLECNFPKPGAEAALMSHDDVTTFFHEFGHVLHQLLTQTALASYGGTSTVRDFVEAPSQVFEEWAWSREVLDLFARHYKTGEKIPEPLFQAMTRSRSFGRALDTQRQLFLAALDLELHSRDPGFDSTKVVEEVENAYDSFPFEKNTHFQSSFAHLIGYDAGYYSYQWALAFSRDVLGRFKKDGMLNPTTAAAWRDDVLAKGGGADELGMIANFLGRAPTDDAYFAYLAGKE